MSDSIITMDVGGQIFRTQLSTLTKYPGSMLATMFSHIDSGLGMFAFSTQGLSILKSNCSFADGFDYYFYPKTKILR